MIRDPTTNRSFHTANIGDDSACSFQQGCDDVRGGSHRSRHKGDERRIVQKRVCDDSTRHSLGADEIVDVLAVHHPATLGQCARN